MIKECIKQVIENKNLVDFKLKMNMLYESFDEHQLEYLLNRTVPLDDTNTIYLSYNAGIGFRCNNNHQNVIGKLPICNQLEKILNKKYVDLINKI